MRKLLLFTLVGIGAQLVDGTLGMAFGVTSTTLLIVSGVGAAHASAAVHLAEVGTTLASGISHWRFENVDTRIVLGLGIPGAVGAFIGATVLSNLSTQAAVPVTSGILLAIGIYVLLRFSHRPHGSAAGDTVIPHRVSFLSPLGLVGGFIDASGGGGWGPITTSTLLSRGKASPRRIIGSVSASEFLVSLAATAGFLVGLGDELFANAAIVAGLLLGGVVAAPIAAWLVARISATILGISVGGLIIVTNAKKLFGPADVNVGIEAAVYVAVVVLTVGLGIRAHRRGRTAGVAEATEALAAAVEARAGAPTRVRVE